MLMFVKSSVIAALTLTVSMSAFAATPSVFGSCDNNRECSAIFSRSLPEAKALCGERTASVIWRKNFQPILLQCVGAATDEEDNVSYIVNGSDVVGLNYGRSVKVNFLQQNPAASIPDKFGSVRICAPANLEKLHNSTFVLLFKRPDETGDSYCYDVTYLSTSVGGVRLDTNARTLSPTNKTYFSGHTSARTRRRVKELIQVFQTWHEEKPD
jgi:hypothetical protein